MGQDTSIGAEVNVRWINVLFLQREMVDSGGDFVLTLPMRT